MINKTEKIWLNGRFIDWEKANTHILTHTLHYGAGVFEGIRFYETSRGPAIFRLNEHVDRLFNSAEIIKIKIPFTKEEIMNAIKETVKINKLKSGYIRPIVFYGYGVMGLNPKGAPVDAAIAVWPWGAYLGEDGLKSGIKAMVSNYVRTTGILNNAKICGSYYVSVLAKLEALNAGYQEAIILDDKENIAEGSGENIFIVKENRLKTPPLGAILPGITRNSVIEIAKELGYKIKEQHFRKNELYSADEVFLTGTAAEITPINEIDGNEIGLGRRGPITEKIQKKFFSIVHGNEKNYLKWLSFV